MKIYALQPVEKFIRSLQPRLEARVHRMIDVLSAADGNLGMPYSRKIDTDLFELRITGNNHVRIFYTYQKNAVVLLHAFKKKSGRIPKKEIDTALARLKQLE
ncbi:MAG: type II toxin-antitoxin system RelE/ParE family toxin [Candidatus Paceibacterota bacterium]